MKGHEGIELDKAVKVPEDNGYRKENYIPWVSAEKPNKLDNLCEGKHENELGPESVLPIF